MYSLFFFSGKMSILYAHRIKIRKTNKITELLTMQSGCMISLHAQRFQFKMKEASQKHLFINQIG